MVLASPMSAVATLLVDVLVCYISLKSARKPNRKSILTLAVRHAANKRRGQ